MANTHKQGFLEGWRTSDGDFDLQAGSRGLDLDTIIRRYFRSPGNVLAVLRFFSGESVDQAAKGSGISKAMLQTYEKGPEAPPLNELTQIARHYGADLRLLLGVFGHLGERAHDEPSMGIAAQFDGQLSDDEKADLRRLVEAFKSRK